MEPHIAPNDLQMFYNYLDKATNYFEFGSGGSTYQASKRANLQHIICVESDLAWINKIKASIGFDDRLTYIHIDINAIGTQWGRPGPKSTLNDWKKYSEAICEYKGLNIDFVLIDGRFRVACCLKCFDTLDEHALIAFDDFLDRPSYHVVLNYFEVLEKTTDKRMVILKKRRTLSPPIELIEKYEKDFE
jgi:hypothetical protein